MTEFMVQPNLCCSSTMRAKQKKSVEIDYDYFFTSVTKARANNYLRVMGDIMCLKPGRTFKFSNGAPNPRCFPYEEFTVKLKNGNSFQINGKDLNESLGYGSNNGYQPFVDVLQNYQERLHDNVDWNKKALSTVAGSQSGLYQAIEMFVSPGDPVLIQSPLYSGVIAALQPLNVEYLEVDSNDNGMCPREVEKILNERKEKNLPMPKIFYVNPTGTNPTGDVMSNQRKKEIYEIACRYNLLILEDDPYFLIRYNDIEKVSSFLSMDSENRVVRFDSASKTLAAGFRIGFVTAAKTIIDKLNIVKSVSSMCPPFTQMVAYKTLTTLGFEGFLNHTHCSSQFYNKCANIVLQSLDEHLKDVATWIIPKAAFFVWIYIKNIDHVPESFIHKCIDNLVLLVPGFAFYAKPRKSPFIRLAFSMLEEDEIKEGIQILARLIKEDLLK